MNLPLIGCSGGDGYASKVLSLANWSVVYDARFPGGTYTDTGATTATRTDGDAVAYIRDWSGNSRQATQGTSSRQSAWQVDLSGTVDGVSTVGDDDTYTVGGSNALNARYLHGFVVVNWTGTPDTVRHHILSSSAGILLRVGRSSETSGAIQLGLGGVGALVTGSGAFGTGIKLLEFQYSDNGVGGGGTDAIKLYENNSLVGQTSYGTAIGGAMLNFMGNGATENWIGDWYCLYAFQSDTAFLAADVRTAVRTQLGTEFGQAWT